MFKFSKTKTGNVQELVYTLMMWHFMTTGNVIDKDTLFERVQNIRYRDNLGYARGTTVARAYRRFRKVIEFQILKQELEIKRLEAENKLLKEEEDKFLYRMYGLAVIVAVLAIMVTSIYLIFN